MNSADRLRPLPAALPLTVPTALPTTPIASPSECRTPARLAERLTTLVAFHRHVQQVRMQGVPLLNDVLSIAVVGFQWAESVEGASPEPVAEGVLVTPWFMSLVRLPAEMLGHDGRVGRTFVRRFANEHFDFIGAYDSGVGYHEACALFSPMGGFTSQDHAVATALAALDLVRGAPAPATAVARATLAPRRAFLLGRTTSRGVSA